MKKLFFYLFLSLTLHGLFFIPIHFSKHKTYKIDGQKKILQARLVIAEPKSTQDKTINPTTVEPSTLMVTHEKSVIFRDSLKVTAKQTIHKNFKTSPIIKESTKRVDRDLKKSSHKPQQKKLTGAQTNQLITIIYQAVHKNKVYPFQSRRLHHQGKVLLAFSLLPSGMIQNLTVKKSSGYLDLDKAALESVRPSQPFKIKNLMTSSQDVAIPITFRLSL